MLNLVKKSLLTIKLGSKSITTFSRGGLNMHDGSQLHKETFAWRVNFTHMITLHEKNKNKQKLLTNSKVYGNSDSKKISIEIKYLNLILITEQG